MKIHELAARAGTVERQIRYMIAEGFVPPPRGPRSQPDYGSDHLAAVRRYLALRRLGLPPAAIKVLDAGGGAVAVPIVEGLSLSLDPLLVGRRLDRSLILERVARALDDLQPEDDDAPGDDDR